MSGAGMSLAKDNVQSISVSGAIINKAEGPGAVSIQNIPGRTSVAKDATIITINGKTTIKHHNSKKTSSDTENDFINADLSGVNFSNKNLFGADFTNADLSGANLSHANLQNAVLINANLSSTNLSGANLKGADLTNAKLDGANTKGTIWK